MYKKFLIATALLLLLGGARAQDATVIDSIKGINDSKVIILSGLQDGQFSFISGDQRYFSGSIGLYSGFVYDLQESKLQQFEDFQLHAYFSPDHYVAAEPGENKSIYIHYNGLDYDLEPIISGYGTYYDNISYWNAQSNGENVVAMGYETQIASNSVTGKIDTVLQNVGVLYNGKTGKVRTLLHSYWPRVMPLRSEDNTGYGSRAHAISADGLVLGGWGTWPIGDAIFSNWNTVFWDLVDLDSKDTVYTYAIQDKRFCMSDLIGANSDGSVLVGYNQLTTHGLIIHYDRAAKSFTLDTILPLPGWDFLAFSAVTDDGLVLGRCGMDANPGMSQAVIYSEKMGLITLETFLAEYYDIQANSLFMPTNMSADGSVMAGFFYDRGYTIPWLVQLKGERILPRARNLKAGAVRGKLQVNLTWQRPLYSTEILTGYNIYRDGQDTPVATLGADVLSHTDIVPADGTYQYSIEAVYGEKKSNRISSNKVIAIERGSYPVQEIASLVTYNRYARLYWGLPSAEIMETSATRLAKGQKAEIDRGPVAASPVIAQPTADASKRAAKKYANPNLDYIYSIDMKTTSGYGGIKIGDQYFLSSWQGGGIKVMNRYNEIDTIYNPENLGAVLSMAYIEQGNRKELYCGTLTDVNIIDLNHPNTIARTFPADDGARSVVYVPDYKYEGGEGALFVANWETCNAFTLTGTHIGLVDLDFSGLTIAGMAYYNGTLYVASQTGRYSNEIYLFDLETGERSEPIQLMEDPAIYNLMTDNGEATWLDDVTCAASLSICTLDDGTVALGAVYQCNYITCRFAFLEIESEANQNGYNLYRSHNGETPVLLNKEPLNTRRFNEELGEDGVYTYHVIALSEFGNSVESPKDTIRIADQGTCLPALNIQARETNRWVALEWDVPTSDSAAGLIGFTVFRDGQQLKQLWNMEAAVDYTDFSTLELGKPYTYRIEAVYSGGCVASDSVQITLTDEGEAMPPFGIRIDYKKNANATADNKIYDVTAKWETPMFEQPLAIGYGTGQMMTGASFNDEINEYWAAIGWDSIDLKLYKDLYLVGMEYFLGDNVRSFEAVVIMNNQLTYTESLRRTQAQAWQTMMFKQSIPMNQPVEAVLGYHVTYSAGATPIAIDFSYNKPFYSDLVSFDGQGWYSLAKNDIAASWCIRGLVARKRDLDEATTNGVVDFSKLEGKVMRMEKGTMPASLHINAAKNMAKAPAKAPWSLQGFNIFRQRMDIDNQDEIQLNDAPLTTFSYTEAEPLPEGDYDYTVEAVYSNATKNATVSVTLTDVSTETGLDKLSLSLYPNPASEVVYVNGAFSELQILDLGGRVLRSLGSASQIEVGNLTPGTYFFRFADQDGRKATYKVVIR